MAAKLRLRKCNTIEESVSSNISEKKCERRVVKEGSDTKENVCKDQVEKVITSD